MKQSCDTYFYEVARLLGVDRLNITAKKFGLGKKVLGKYFDNEKIKDATNRYNEFRKNHSLKYWKLSPNDLLSVSSWDRYTYFKEKTFEKTSYKAAPWIVINANNKMTARLNALRYLLETVDYENKKILKPKSWTINENSKSIMLQDVMFNDLNESQYQLLNEIKQIL